MHVDEQHEDDLNDLQVRLVLDIDVQIANEDGQPADADQLEQFDEPGNREDKLRLDSHRFENHIEGDSRHHIDEEVRLQIVD